MSACGQSMKPHASLGKGCWHARLRQAEPAAWQWGRLCSRGRGRGAGRALVLLGFSGAPMGSGHGCGRAPQRHLKSMHQHVRLGCIRMHACMQPKSSQRPAAECPELRLANLRTGSSVCDRTQGARLSVPIAPVSCFSSPRRGFTALLQPNHLNLCPLMHWRQRPLPPDARTSTLSAAL